MTMKVAAMIKYFTAPLGLGDADQAESATQRMEVRRKLAATERKLLALLDAESEVMQVTDERPVERKHAR